MNKYFFYLRVRLQSVCLKLPREMDSTKKLEILFQIFAFGVFIFQMQNSLSKYFSRPTIQQISTQHFDKIYKPMIYFCQANNITNNLTNKNGPDRFYYFMWFFCLCILHFNLFLQCREILHPY